MAVLQEVHSGGDDETQAWMASALGRGRPWGGEAFWAHGRPGSRGVAVLFGSGFEGNDFQLEYSSSGAGGEAAGRVLRVGWRDAGSQQRWSVVAVYAPNDDAARRDFFSQGGPVARALAAGRAGAHVVVTGDFNCILDADDSSSPSGAAETASAGAVALRGLLAGAGLADAWLTHRARSAAPDGRFTHFPARGCARRLDRAYVSQSLSPPTKLIDCRHLPLGDLPGDHFFFCNDGYTIWHMLASNKCIRVNLDGEGT